MDYNTNKIEWNYQPYELSSAMMNMKCDSSFLTSIFAHSNEVQKNKYVSDYWRDMHAYMFNFLSDVVVSKVQSGEEFTPQLVEDTVVELEKEFQASSGMTVELPIEPISAIRYTVRKAYPYIKNMIEKSATN